MILAHCVVALIYLVACGLCFVSGGMAFYLRGRYWGMIFFMSCSGAISTGIMIYLKLQDIVSGKSGGDTVIWMMHDMVQGSFVIVCAMTATIYMINWRPPSERH